MAGLTLRNVGKRYGALSIIQGLNLDIRDGEFLVLVGPSGCGKSTLLRMIAGLEDISEGTIAIGGRIVNDLPASKRELSMVFQSYALYPHMNVRKNLAFGLQNFNVPRQQVEHRVAEAARILQIEQLMDRKPRQLSGGQKQRVAIGRAIVREPQLFLFDEPLSNLDAELRVQMRAELASLYTRLGTTMIYVTHDQVEAMTMASRIVVLRGGKIEQVGTPQELYTRPQNLFVAGFIGSPKINMLQAKVLREAGETLVDIADLPRFAIPALTATSEVMTLCVRPSSLRVGGGDVTTEGTIRLVEYLGSETLLHVALPSGQVLLASDSGRNPCRMGDPVTIGFDLFDLHYFDSAGQRVEPTQNESLVQ
ncbi:MULTISPECIES: sn-glycerol-3-phosphate ABC transporter ATP-binding protein UgpC [Rhizobium/Agrobacterium group]|uniref:Sn-glycerol-3-phosphate ABC transporter ATP-binding protein UgpC n=2 Tax=Neorhizobium TaxID=1525371 RepID=A0ABV0LYW3_9HYPH|nr:MULTISPECIES: sn-glycerol-3-phosphate ABC transporter ATP-binding protein UgpC [Rhizobium/Agrobacterium group]KGD87617.1 ABC transporter ATP-binding protein [Rhizobium sp. YS-1r]MCC2612293.1 sn-glycerol-3-phosphate ABC transporter ATP-binding protein UgpC [Neorhizobium petrolearium]WGI67434.1 sn-glycerol-3-phosphate ABC transporter ATP-binding protein UgpC [Neorhizobium petrolearium]